VAKVVQQLPRHLVVFHYTVQPGAAHPPYGIEMACLAGLPRSVADRTKALLADATRENGAEAVAEDRAGGQECAVAPPPTPAPTPAEQLADELRPLVLDAMKARVALQRLWEQQERLRD
jgi:DNA mismatch repair ATPase MutS